MTIPRGEFIGSPIFKADSKVEATALVEVLVLDEEPIFERILELFVQDNVRNGDLWR